MLHGRTVLGPFALGSLLLMALAPPASAQQKQSCHIICAPGVTFRPSLMRTHAFGGPRIRVDSTGAVKNVPSQTAFAMQFDASAPTQIPRTSVYATVTWFPNLASSANPFTEYTANEVPGTHIRTNTPSIGVGAFVDVITTQQTGGWFDVGGYIGDSFSKAAQPTDASDYTHKLDLGVTATLHPFSSLPTSNYLHAVTLLADYDYRATGLPSKGDDVPRGTRTFLTGARPSLLQFAFAFPVAPLFPKQ